MNKNHNGIPKTGFTEFYGLKRVPAHSKRTWDKAGEETTKEANGSEKGFELGC